MDKKKEEKTKIPFRINILFILIFLLFSGVIIQLGLIQIVEGEAYQVEIDRTIEDIANNPFPRGKIFDRKGRVVVDNKPMYAITYTPPKRVQPTDKLKLAEKLVDYMDVSKKDLKKVTDFNKQEYIYLKMTEEIEERVSEEETEDMDDGEVYRHTLDQITDKELDAIDDDEMKVIAIKRELDKAYALTPQIIKNENISPNEYARIAENLTDLPGISVSSDWDRIYAFKDRLRSVFGSITTQDQGIPAEGEDAYLLTGYNRNDRVGKSGLEQQYEDVLRGNKERVKYTTTKEGEIISSEIISPGERGKDLMLSIDMEYQKKVDDIVKDELQKAKSASGNRFLEDAMAVVMDPKTGEVLALSGQHLDKETNKIESNPLMTIHNANTPGSTVKGATVLAGFNSEVISPGQVFHDSPIKVKDTPLKGSYTGNLGSVDDVSALKRSSNVYMFYIALRMMGEYRYPFPDNGIPTFNREAVQTIRNNFNQFGLGVQTGIDFPSESIGVVGSNPDPGNIMDFAIGQYDDYTAMQLAQYISTIANDGIRVKPKLVNSILYPSVEDELGGVYRQLDTETLNEIEMSAEELKRVQDGMYKVFNESGGTGHTYWANKKYKPAGKTGTAETYTFEDGTRYDTQNLTLVGYAPYDDPEVAFAVVVPRLDNTRGQYQINHYIGTRIMDAYFDSKTDEEDAR